MSKKKPARTGKPYTQTDMRRMRKCARSRMSARLTAAFLGRSPGALRVKACTVGVRFRSINRAA